MRLSQLAAAFSSVQRSTAYCGVVRPQLPGDRQAARLALAEADGSSQSRARGRLAGARPIVRAGAVVLGIAALLVMLNWTTITDPVHMDADFHTDSWFMEHQAASLRQSLIPSLSMTADAAAFYPIFVFYGGTLFVLGGLVTLLVGSGDAAETILSIFALAAAYGGWLWLARMAGLRSWVAHAPAILYVTAPYVVANINVREDFVELVATSAMPLMVASALSVLCADRLRAGPAAALAVSVVLFGGSHNLTLLWGTTILAIAILAVVVGVPSARRQVSTRGVLRVLLIVVPAISVNAWSLLPNLAYHSDTIIASRIDEWKALLGGPHPELGAKYLYALGRPSKLEPGLSITLPVLAMAWVVVAALVSRGQWQGAWARMLAVLTVLTAGILTVMTNPQWIRALPDPWQMVQFSYRLETYALFGICGAMIAALVLVERSGRRWLTGLLPAILVFSVIGAAIQRHDALRGGKGHVLNIDKSAPFSVGDFNDAKLRKVPRASDDSPLVFTRADVKRSRIVRDVRAAPGDLLYTSLMTPSKLLHVDGARVVGRWPGAPAGPGWQTRWALVLQVADDAQPGKARIVIEQTHSLPVVAGRIISLLGLVTLAGIGAVMVAGAMRRRRVRSDGRRDAVGMSLHG